MMDKRLEEHIERVRQLSARVTQIHEQLAQNTQLIARDREHMSGSPLQEARDLRTWTQRAGGDGRRECTGLERSEASSRPRARRGGR